MRCSQDLRQNSNQTPTSLRLSPDLSGFHSSERLWGVIVNMSVFPVISHTKKVLKQNHCSALISIWSQDPGREGQRLRGWKLEGGSGELEAGRWGLEDGS